MVTGSSIAERWVSLADVPDGERVDRMKTLLGEVVPLEQGERLQTIEGMVQAEYALDDERLRPFTVSRLRAWLAIADENMEDALALARGYDAAFDHLGAAMAMRRSTMVQTVARQDLQPAEVTGLFDLIPSIVRQVPRAIPETRHYDKPEEKKKPFWKFW